MDRATTPPSPPSRCRCCSSFPGCMRTITSPAIPGTKSTRRMPPSCCSWWRKSARICAKRPTGHCSCGLRNRSIPGMWRGGVLVEFDGKPIQNLYDFTYALRAKKPGDEVIVKVMRGSEMVEVKVLLTKRKKDVVFHRIGYERGDLCATIPARSVLRDLAPDRDNMGALDLGASHSRI